MIERKTTQRVALVAVLAGALLMADPAFAHHVMGGRLPATFGEGLLSGLGHPVIGIDHLAFLVAVGVAVGVAGLNLMMPALWAGLLAAAGLVHGYAYGESIFGAETSPLAAYLIGLVVIQSALAIGVA